MRGMVSLLSAVIALASVVVYMAHATGDAAGEAAPIFGIKIPSGYRNWKLISVAHEEGNLNDLRAVLSRLDEALEERASRWAFDLLSRGRVGGCPRRPATNHRSLGTPR
jgi:hypothetical protein